MADDSYVASFRVGPPEAKVPQQQCALLTGADGRLPGNLAVGISYIEPERAPGKAQTARVRAGHGASPNGAADERPVLARG